jgi:UDP-N-acetylmuramyl pentapeptide synthase
MRIIRWLKRLTYFWVAHYFGFWASRYLRRWQPSIVAVIGSSGKTTLLHLFEAQLKTKARFTHKANSTFWHSLSYFRT